MRLRNVLFGVDKLATIPSALFLLGRLRRCGDQPSNNGNDASNRETKFYFNIQTMSTFECKLEAIQENLGLEPDDFASVTYVQK